MQIYMAAVYTNNYMRGQNRYVKLTDREREIVHGLPHILESWHYVGKQKYVDDMRREGARVFLDSGAFSAYTLGIKLSVQEYCEYIQRNLDIIRVEDGAVMASVLDGIGDADQTWRNQMEMEWRGVRPLPCFHFGEPPEALEWYVKNYEYITLGGMVGASTEQLRNWLERVWEHYLLDGSGRARLKVHGFGITAIPLMQEFDWYSCDSSSWIQSAAFGTVVHPTWGPLSVSEKSPSRHDENQHVTTLSPLHQQVVFKNLVDNGFEYERLSTVYESRAAYNLWAFGEINKLMDQQRRANYLTAKRQDLFGMM